MDRFFEYHIEDLAGDNANKEMVKQVERIHNKFKKHNSLFKNTLYVIFYKFDEAKFESDELTGLIQLITHCRINISYPFGNV